MDTLSSHACEVNYKEEEYWEIVLSALSAPALEAQLIQLGADQ